MAKNNNPSRQVSRKKSSSVKPLAILAVGAAGALAIALFLSSGEAEPTTAADAPATFDASGGGQTLGAENPAVTLVEYGDYECPHCADFHHIVSELMRRMPNELALEFHHYPLPVGPNSMPASLAAEAAGEQGRYWEMHDMIFESQRQWTGRPDGADIFTSMAGQLGMDTEQFRRDMQSEEIARRVVQDKLRGNALRITGTPTFFINGRRLDYLPQSADEFEAVIRSVMSR